MSKLATLLLIAAFTASLFMVKAAPASAAIKPSVPDFTVKLVAHPYDVPTTYSTDPYTGEKITHLGYHVENKIIEVTIKNQPSVYGADYTLYYNVRFKGHFEDNWVELYSYSDSSSGNLPPRTDSQYTVLSLPANYPPNVQVDFQVEAILAHRYERQGFSDDWLAQHPLAEVMQPGLKDSYVQEFAIAGSSGWSNTQTVAVPAPVTLLLSQNELFGTSDVPLHFAAGNQALQFKYSLDGGANVTVAGNTTLTALSNGYHNVTVYATDEFGNTGATETIYFNVEAPELFTNWLIIAVIIIVLVIVAVSLSFYFQKRKREAEQT
jgi:hypothetical protein